MENKKNIVITDELIATYLAGEATPEEAVVLQEWLIDPTNRVHFKNLEAVWYATYPSRKPRAIDQVASWKKVSVGVHASPSVTRYFSINFVLKSAATLLVLIVAGVWVHHGVRNSKIDTVSLVTGETIREARLPDQSTITLSKHTTLRYTDAFGKSLREVHLTGEAFFNIAADADKPFIVHTSHADIKVVGTSFNIMEKPDRLEVSVAEGKVSVYSARSRRDLQAGETALITQDSILVKTVVNPNSWGYATHLFVFKDTHLREVFAAIVKGSHHVIKVNNKAIGNCKLTATFENSSAESIVTMIAETLDFKVTKDGVAFILEGKGCP